MSIYGGKELANAFRTVRQNTMKVAEDIPEDKYSFVAAPEVRTVARMLTHVAISTCVSMRATVRTSGAATKLYLSSGISSATFMVFWRTVRNALANSFPP